MKQLLFIYGFFLLDSFIKNFYIIYGWLLGITMEYQRANDMWNASLMVSGTLVYPAFYLLQRWKILPFDVFDCAIIIICGIFAFIDAMDWFWNFNMRNETMDWTVFLSVNVTILAMKYFLNKNNLGKNITLWKNPLK